jgi:hypothetical protein
MASSKIDKIKKSFQFFTEKEKNGELFSFSDIVKYTGWAEGTVKTYPTKKWDKFLIKKGKQFLVNGIRNFSEDEYVRMMSQADRLSNDPKKPDLPLEVERMVTKARESAILALDIYNRPATTFRTEGFTVMMIIAWTALFHAIFEQRSIIYFYLEDDGSPKLVDGDEKAWELSNCIDVYYNGTTNPIRKNLEFFIGLRNKIEHRYVPAFDPHVAGECQALLLNFDELLVDKFGEYYALRESLTVPLQTVAIRSESQTLAMKKFQGKQYEDLKEYIEIFRSELTDAIYQDPKFSFRVYMIPKIGNHASTSDIAFEFVKYDPNKPSDNEALQKQVALIREKQVPVVNPGRFKPSEVAKIVSQKIGRLFTVPIHTSSWKYYKIRESGEHPESCNIRFCQFDQVHRDYIYTQEWIDFLTKKLSEESEYEKVHSFRG